VFRIFHEILLFERETAMELYAKAALVDYKKLAAHQTRCALVDAEECLKSAFSADVRPAIREWAASKGLPVDPMDAFRQRRYQERIETERGERNKASVGSYA
jgi:L-rhamnose isomerase/sugar isomerase